ncbi:MAG: D-alanyl-D-alanine dipeptidase [Candidatus Methylacidiphilales bacterium]
MIRVWARCISLFLGVVFLAPVQTQGAAPQSVLLPVEEHLPDVIIDLRYATPDNFTRTTVYDPSRARALLRRETILKLRGVVRDLRAQGYRLIILDAYRPRSAQFKLWSANPNGDFLADPNEGSRHSRGTTVDVWLADREGRRVEKPSDFDEFTVRASHHLIWASSVARMHVIILRNAFFKNGFSGVENEWWHYDLKNWKDFPLLDEEPF